MGARNEMNYYWQDFFPLLIHICYFNNVFSLLLRVCQFIFIGLNIFHSGIKYTEKDWVLHKVRHCPLLIFIEHCDYTIIPFNSFYLSASIPCACLKVCPIFGQSGILCWSVNSYTVIPFNSFYLSSSMCLQLSKLLKHCPNLEHLDITQTRVGDTGLKR